MELMSFLAGNGVIGAKNLEAKQCEPQANTSATLAQNEDLAGVPVNRGKPGIPILEAAGPIADISPDHILNRNRNSR